VVSGLAKCAASAIGARACQPGSSDVSKRQSGAGIAAGRLSAAFLPLVPGRRPGRPTTARVNSSIVCMAATYRCATTLRRMVKVMDLNAEERRVIEGWIERSPRDATLQGIDPGVGPPRPGEAQITERACICRPFPVAGARHVPESDARIVHQYRDAA
jgi:hypothetical protein